MKQRTNAGGYRLRAALWTALACLSAVFLTGWPGFPAVRAEEPAAVVTDAKTARSYQGEDNWYYLCGDFAAGSLWRMYRNEGVGRGWWQGAGDLYNMINPASGNGLYARAGDVMAAYVLPCYGNLKLTGRVVVNLLEAGRTQTVKIILRTADGTDEILLDETVTEAGEGENDDLEPEIPERPVRAGETLFFLAETNDELVAWDYVVFDVTCTLTPSGISSREAESVLETQKMPMTGAHEIAVTGGVVDYHPILTESMKLDQTAHEKMCFQGLDGNFALFTYLDGTYYVDGGTIDYEDCSTGVQEYRVFYSNSSWTGYAGMMFDAAAAGRVSLLGRAVVAPGAVGKLYRVSGTAGTLLGEIPAGTADLSAVSAAQDVELAAGEALALVFESGAWNSSSLAAAFDFVAAPQVEVGEGIPAESVQISGEGVVAGAVSLTVGQKLGMTAAVLPTETTDPGVRWTSSDEAVAAVSADGTVTAVAAGSAVIVATTVDGTELSAEVTVTVKAKPDEGGSGEEGGSGNEGGSGEGGSGNKGGSGNEGGSGSGTESGAGGCKGNLAGGGRALAAVALTLGALGWRAKRKQRREHP